MSDILARTWVSSAIMTGFNALVDFFFNSNVRSREFSIVAEIINQPISEYIKKKSDPVSFTLEDDFRSIFS